MTEWVRVANLCPLSGQRAAPVPDQGSRRMAPCPSCDGRPTTLVRAPGGGYQFSSHVRYGRVRRAPNAR